MKRHEKSTDTVITDKLKQKLATNGVGKSANHSGTKYRQVRPTDHHTVAGPAGALGYRQLRQRHGYRLKLTHNAQNAQMHTDL